MDQFSQNDGGGALYRRRRSVKLFGVRLGPRRQVLYAGLTILFSIFVNLVFLWPVNHFWALMLISVSVSSVLFSDMKRGAAIGASVSVFAVAGILYALIGPATVHLAAQDLKWIVPGNAPAPANICDSAAHVPADAKRVLVGDSGVLMHEGQNTPVLAIGDCKSVSMYATGSGLLVNVDDYDDYGHVLFRIVNNQLRLVNGQAAYVARAPDHGSATVHGADDEELVRITWLNPRTLVVRGVFACKGHAPVRIEEARPIPGMGAPVCLDGRAIAVP